MKPYRPPQKPRNVAATLKAGKEILEKVHDLISNAIEGDGEEAVEIDWDKFQRVNTIWKTRQARHLAQSVLAAEVGISQQHLNLIEHSAALCHRVLVPRFERALGMSREAIFPNMPAAAWGADATQDDARAADVVMSGIDPSPRFHEVTLHLRSGAVVRMPVNSYSIRILKLFTPGGPHHGERYFVGVESGEFSARVNLDHLLRWEETTHDTMPDGWFTAHMAPEWEITVHHGQPGSTPTRIAMDQESGDPEFHDEGHVLSCLSAMETAERDDGLPFSCIDVNDREIEIPLCDIAMVMVPAHLVFIPEHDFEGVAAGSPALPPARALN